MDILSFSKVRIFSKFMLFGEAKGLCMAKGAGFGKCSMAGEDSIDLYTE